MIPSTDGGPRRGRGSSRMRVEVEEIPSVVERLLLEDDALDRAVDAVRRGSPRWIATAGRGTSGHVAVYARYLIETLLGLPSGLALPSVTTLYRRSLGWDGGMLLAISQSGRSPDVVALTAAAARAGALTVAVTNDSVSPLATAADIVLPCLAGGEEAVPATKTYVACCVQVARLVAGLANDAELSGALPRLGSHLADALDASQAWLSDGAGAALVHRLAEADRALLVSRGYNLATAMEVALKLKEAASIFAAGYSSADLQHGPMVLATPDVPIVAFRPDGAAGRAVDEVLETVRGRGLEPWIVGGDELGNLPRTLSLVPGLPEPLTPLAYVLPGQLLTERVAWARGMNPDEPQGLRKVTMTR